MSRLKKVGIFIWTILPYMVLANINGIETDAIARAYESKECQYQAYEYREKDYQKRYDEGLEKGREEGYGQAKIVAFNFIMQVLDKMGELEEDENHQEPIRTASTHLSQTKNEVHY